LQLIQKFDDGVVAKIDLEALHSISTLRLLDFYSAELGDYVRRRPLDTAGTTNFPLEGRSCREIT